MSERLRYAATGTCVPDHAALADIVGGVELQITYLI